MDCTTTERRGVNTARAPLRNLLSAASLSEMSAAGIAPEALAEVVSIAEAADVAWEKQRHMRAAELFERAAARAVAAGAPPDSLVCASLLAQRATVRAGLLVDQPLLADAPSMSADAWATTREVMRTVNARDEAGTLLPGGLRADELAFAEVMAAFTYRVKLPHHTRDVAAMAMLKAEAPLLGYYAAL